MASSAFDIAAVAAKIQTAGALRVAMGAVAQILQKGYDALGITGPASSVPNLVAGTGAAAKSLLDTVNTSAQILYNIYPADGSLDDQDISTAHAISAAHVISEASDAVKSVEQAIGTNIGNVAQFVQDALAASGQIAATTVNTVAKGAIAGIAAFGFAAWPTLLLIGFGVVIFFWARARLLRKLVG